MTSKSRTDKPRTDKRRDDETNPFAPNFTEGVEPQSQSRSTKTATLATSSASASAVASSARDTRSRGEVLSSREEREKSRAKLIDSKQPMKPGDARAKLFESRSQRQQDRQQDQQLQVQQEMERSNDEILDSAIQHAAMATETGASTLTSLQVQKEQLQRIDGHLNDINANLSRSERILRGMKSVGGAIANVFTKRPEHHSTLYDKKQQIDDPKLKKGAKANVNSVVSQGSISNPCTPVAVTRTVQSTTGDSKTDEQLDVLLNYMTTLKSQASDMNSTLTEQAGMIDHIDSVVDHTTTRLQKNVKTIGKIS